ncbi:hypothetical protein SAMN06269185_0209 [Natronoarchaeum philippinense]|uniref:Uncharacterized protein n=1 Tax=Natronoarchaeum philippinense TaxID=558529 RepID=A0A285N5A2_NATPI|nr:hypothetical protein [Natronoarchaeum philippinense]SNZ03176.1 hypothetical protein SAMN06269185_0209 [Natronoarchaeum philippinense]
MTGIASVSVVLLQAGIVALFAVALRRGDAAAAVNALVSLAATLLPAAVELLLAATGTPGVRFGTALPLWIALAGLLHSYGMLGPYDTISWWDSLTHTLSAGLVAALLYAALLVAAPTAAGWLVAAATVGATFVVGVFWELIELVAREVGRRYDVEPVLVHYGWRDTALDLVFDVVGALLVVLLDVRMFVTVAEAFPETVETLLVVSSGVVTVGSVLMVLVVDFGEA